MALQKQFTVQLSGQDGSSFKTSLSPRVLKSTPAFHDRINGGQGELVLDLALPFDDFGEGTDIDFMHVCRVYAVDEDHPRGRLIYTGFVSRYEPYVETGGQEGVRVTCLGLGSIAALAQYGTSPDYSVTHTGEDPEAVGRAIVDNLNANFGGSLFSYSAASTDPVGTNVTYTFTGLTCFDALRRTGEMAGNGWWWKVDESGIYHLKAKPSTPTHRFTIGRNIQSLTCPKDSEGVRNEIIVVRNGGTKSTYTDATSQATYGTGSPGTGRRTKVINDSSIADATTADRRGQKELNDAKDAKVRATVVVDTNYDLESIHVGETCEILNLANASAFFGANNLLIVGTHYRGDTVSVELEGPDADLGLELEAFLG